jgi:glycosyltransferase involved in cell wall biosynthesis
MNKRIAIITDRYNPQINGVVTIVNNIEKEFIKSKIDYKIFSTYDCKNIDIPFYKQIQIGLNPWKLKKDFLSYSPDIVIIMTEATLGQYFKKLCVKNKIKFVTFYNTNFHLYVNKKIGNVILKFIRNFHKKSSRIYTVSESSKRFLESVGFENVAIFNVGVDSSVFRPKNNHPKTAFKRLTYVGRISREKNITAFLDLEENELYKKIVVGDGPLLETYKEKYPDVMFVGPVEHEKLGEIYNNTDVFVFPSKTDTLGMVMIESIACGTPVAAFPCSGPADVVVNGVNGFLNDDLNRAIELSLSIDRKKCAASAKKYSWKKSCKALIKDLELFS